MSDRRSIARSTMVMLSMASACLPLGQASATDLLTVYQLAQENDRSFSAASNSFKAAKQAQRQIKGLYYPNLDVNLEHIETDQQINRSDNEVFGSGQSDFPTDVLSLSLTQPIFRWDYISQRKVARAEVKQAEYEHIAAEQELMLRSAEGYLLSLAAMDNEFVTKAELDAVGQQLKLAEKKLEVGLANPTEVHESRARLELNQSEVIEAENAVINQWEGLRIITGDFEGELIPLKDDFKMVMPDPPNPELWVAQAQQNNLGVKALESAVDAARAEFKVQKAGRYPTVDLIARFNNRDTGGSLFGGGSDVDTTDILVRASWTVFQGGSLKARVREAMFELKRAEDDLELQRRNVRRETRNAYLGVVSNIAKAKALQLALDAQEFTVEAKQKGFETGSNTNLDVLDAKRDFFFVQRDFLSARYQYLLSLLNLKRQVGSLSPDDLAMVNNMLQVASINSVSELQQAQTIALPDVVVKAEPQNIEPEKLIESEEVKVVEELDDLNKIAQSEGDAKSTSENSKQLNEDTNLVAAKALDLTNTDKEGLKDELLSEEGSQGVVVNDEEKIVEELIEVEEIDQPISVLLAINLIDTDQLSDEVSDQILFVSTAKENVLLAAETLAMQHDSTRLKVSQYGQSALAQFSLELGASKEIDQKPTVEVRKTSDQVEGLAVEQSSTININEVVVAATPQNIRKANLNISQESEQQDKKEELVVKEALEQSEQTPTQLIDQTTEREVDAELLYLSSQFKSLASELESIEAIFANKQVDDLDSGEQASKPDTNGEEEGIDQAAMPGLNNDQVALDHELVELSKNSVRPMPNPLFDIALVDDGNENQIQR